MTCKIRPRLWFTSFLLISYIFSYSSLQAQVNVTTQRYDGFRTSSNLQETILNPTTVSPSTFGQLWSYAVDGDVYAQPLYVQNVNISGVGLRNVVYIVTMHDVVYAFNADSPGPPLWTVDLRNAAAGITPYLSANYENPKWVTPIGDAFGIQSTPVINLSANLMYVVAQTSEPSGIVYRLHAFDIRSGVEPIPATVIQATSAGITFEAAWQCQRPALALSGGQVYIGFGGRPDDDGTYYGWLMTYSATTLVQTGVFVVNSTSYGGAIWEGGGGPATDENGNVYAVSGNGFGSGDGVTNFSESLMKFSFTNSQLSLMDWFTPADNAYLDANDLDMSTNGPLVIPGASLVATGGKSADFYMSGTASLGKMTATNSGVAQTFHIGVGTFAEYGQANLTTGFALWPQGQGSILYAWPGRDFVYSYSLSGNQFSPLATGTLQSSSAPGPSMVLTANGTQNGSGILWSEMSLVPEGYTAGNAGVLRALNAASLAELWDSNLNSARDGIAANAKYAVPTVVNGRVYAPTFSGLIQVYGLLASQNFSLTASSPAFTVGQASSGTSTVTAVAANGFSGTVTYAASGVPAGVTVSFSPASTTASGQTVVTVSVAATVAGGSTYPITITGTNGNLTESTTLQVTIPAHAAPAVSITSPANNATFVTGSNIAIAAQASANGVASVSQVTFLDGTTTLGTVTTAPYTFTWANVAAGTYQLTAKVTDSLGGTATSSLVTVVVSLPVTISVAPATVTLTANQTKQFSATVGNTSNTSVTWSTPAIGSMSAAGVYTAPAAIAVQQTVTITATSAADTSKVATAAITLAPPPDFALTATPATVTFAPGGAATIQVAVASLNGFSGSPSFTVSGLPANVTGGFSPTSSSTGTAFTLTASTNAVVGTYAVTVTGTSAALVHSVGLSVTLSGSAVDVSLATVANVYGIYGDGNPTIDGALDGLGDAYSANVLGSTLSAMGAWFSFGAPGTENAVTSTTIALPSGNFAALKILGTGNNGSGSPIAAASRNRPNQTFVVTYTDGTTTTFTQSLSDWATPQNYAGETVAATMAYTDNSSGAKASGPWYLYGYSFTLDNSKTVKSLTLPNNRGVVVLAAALIYPPPAVSVSLTSASNVNGIFNDGSRPSNGGLDNDGYAYSSNLLGGSVSALGVTFSLGASGSPDAVYGKTIALPAGNFSNLKFLATGVNGNQVNQNFVVTYTDGTTSTFTQSLSDWAYPSNYAGQSVVSTLAYRVTPTGGSESGPFDVYGYSFKLNSAKTVKSFTLPNTRNVVVLGISLQ